MNEQALREELYAFYLHGDAERARSFAQRCFRILDDTVRPEMSVTEQKMLQYDVITEEFSPVIFPHSPYYFETGVLTSLSDGARYAKGHPFIQANGWVFERNKHLFREFDEELYRLAEAQKKELLYLICGDYNDDCQHFNFNNRPFLNIGIKGICEKAETEMSNAKNEEELAFLRSVCHGMHALRRMAERFSKKAEQMLEDAKDPEVISNLTRIKETAARVPWEAPETLYEALATLAFLRKALGSLEGVGPNTFGRLDMDLLPFYQRDLAEGRITKEDAYSLISEFLILWDCHYDHDMPMVGYADHELENTYVLGGCDSDGTPLYNDLTALFLRATREHHIIFPKIKCRFSKDSPEEYLDEISSSIVQGTSTVLLQNDDATIPSLIRAGRPLSETRDYLITGCWGTATYQEKFDHGNYLNLLKPLEFSVHAMAEKAKRLGFSIEPLDGATDFEELYQRTLRNCLSLLDARLDVTRRAGHLLSQVDRFPIFSSTLDDCLRKHADFTMGGGRYRDDYLLIFGLPNIVDSLLAIKELVFDAKKYSLDEYLSAVRDNWEGHEEIRMDAIRSHGWGDGSSESGMLAARLNQDLYEACTVRTGSYGGRVHIGHLTYTEIRFWGEKTLATPDGRKSGDYFAQGVTPSRLKRIPDVTRVIASMAQLDPSTTAAGSVLNVLLPYGISQDRCVGFLRAVAHTAVQSLQLNCASKEILLDAQTHPEHYPDLIVRVTGFSAKFTSLSKEWQDEVISRNFYD